MAAGVPPPPLNSPSGSYYWLEWYTNLTNFLNGTNIPWSNINFTGSNLADLQTRLHNSLSSIQGGNASGDVHATGNAWHALARGYVTGAGVETGLPTGWSCTHSATGVYTITHNLGLVAPQLMAVATSNQIGAIANYIDNTTSSTSIVVHMSNTSGTSVDAAFTLLVWT
jgi:hypothetical protein